MARQGLHSELTFWVFFFSECDPGLCEEEEVPTCREDQILIEGRLGDTCCTSYFCGRWLWAVCISPFLMPASVGD